MAASGLASIADAGAARGPPTVPVRWCSSCSDWLLQHVLHPGSPERRRQRHLGEPLLIAALTAWVTLSYVVCGLVAWWRRPANRFGPLLIIAGSSTSFRRWSGRAETSCALLGRRSTWCRRFSSCTSFWHFPDGRLKGRFVRSFVATAYVVAIALELVRMSAGDFGPHNSSRARKHQVKVSIADAQARLHGRYPSIGSVSSRDARSTARATWIRDDTSSLRKMLRMCDSTVL